MKITEKLYIERLEGMVKKYKKNPCDHCPMIENYGLEKKMIDGNKYDWGDNPSCGICHKLTAKYNDFEDKEIFLKSNKWCPCIFFKEIADEDKMLENYMIKIAWNVIRGWKKDNKEK